MKQFLSFLFYLSFLASHSLAYSSAGGGLPQGSEASEASETSTGVFSSSGLESSGGESVVAVSSSGLESSADGSRADSDLHEVHKFMLKAQVKDSYAWSEKQKRYNLRESQFNFKVLLDEGNSASNKTVDSGNVVDNPKKDRRYLYVGSPNVVYFVSADNGRKTELKAKLSDNKENLKVYLSEQVKSDILSGMISAVEINTASYQSKSKSSDYNCHIENAQLICVISYTLISKSPQEQESVKTAPQSSSI